MKLNICIFGMGYVGCANGLALAQHNSVILVDKLQSKVDRFNDGDLPIEDIEGSTFFKKNKLDIKAVNNFDLIKNNIDYFILALPTDFDPNNSSYHTDAIESVLSLIFQKDKNAKVVIKSTVNIGFTSAMREKFQTKNIFFSPEFLREGSAFHDSLHPTRIIIGDRGQSAKEFSNLLLNASHNKTPNVLYMSSESAESVKLFSNAYLAMRVAFFNELDTFCLSKKIDTSDVVKGISMDPRIGMFYNNPSFGYGGYCLPKDSKQLLSSFEEIPQELMNAIVESNNTRKNFLITKILEMSPKIVGIYELSMKSGSDNSRDAAVLDIMDKLSASGIEIIIFDKNINHQSSLGYKTHEDFLIFIEQADLILANRLSEQLKPFKDKIFSRDIFNSDL
jgi:UDPglucose 6-dehydrogenase